MWFQCAYDFKFMYPYQFGGSWILALILYLILQPLSYSRSHFWLWQTKHILLLYPYIEMYCACVSVYICSCVRPFLAYGWLLFAMKWFWTFDPIHSIHHSIYMGKCVSYSVRKTRLQIIIPEQLPNVSNTNCRGIKQSIFCIIFILVNKKKESQFNWFWNEIDIIWILTLIHIIRFEIILKVQLSNAFLSIDFHFVWIFCGRSGFPLLMRQI